MKLFIVSLAAGILVGVVYGLLHVRSPAPPAVALLGLLGMLIGEQLVPLASRAIKGEGVTAAWFAAECVPKISGTAPATPAGEASANTSEGEIHE
jgi:XapX domain-containing protein